MVHFDVQLIGGIALHRGMIAEMETGEGKTLVATLPVYLNALTGLGVHVVTVNDYLARRDSRVDGRALSSSSASPSAASRTRCRRGNAAPQYACDITYGTNAEFGFDYLRDNGMASTKDEQVQRGHYFAIIDEVDSILIDEARTPLIISGPSTALDPPVRQIQAAGRAARQTPDRALQRARRRGEADCWTPATSDGAGRAAVQAQARPAAQPPAHALHGGAGHAPAAREDRALASTRTRRRRSSSRSRRNSTSPSTRRATTPT